MMNELMRMALEQSGVPGGHSIRPGGVEYHPSPMTTQEKIMAVVLPLLGAAQGIGPRDRSGHRQFDIGGAAQGVAGGLAVGLGGPARRRQDERQAFQQGQQQDFENQMAIRTANRLEQPDPPKPVSYDFRSTPQGLARGNPQTGQAEIIPGFEAPPEAPPAPVTVQTMPDGTKVLMQGGKAIGHDFPGAGSGAGGDAGARPSPYHARTLNELYTQRDELKRAIVSNDYEVRKYAMNPDTATPAPQDRRSELMRELDSVEGQIQGSEGLGGPISQEISPTLNAPRSWPGYTPPRQATKPPAFSRIGAR